MVELLSPLEDVYVILCEQSCDVADVVDCSRSRRGKRDWEFIDALIELQFAGVFIGFEVKKDEGDLIRDLSNDKVTILIEV